VSAILLHVLASKFCSAVLVLNAILEVFYSWFIPKPFSNFVLIVYSTWLILGGLTITHCLVPSLHHQLIYHTLFSCKYILLVLLSCPVFVLDANHSEMHFSGIFPTIIWAVQSQGLWRRHSSKAILFCSLSLTKSTIRNGKWGNFYLQISISLPLKIEFCYGVSGVLERYLEILKILFNLDFYYVIDKLIILVSGPH
jgi:hypothetical protein